MSEVFEGKRTTDLGTLFKRWIEHNDETERVPDGLDIGFNWGTVVAFHHVGYIDIVEYYPWHVRGVSILTGVPDRSDGTSFHVWVDRRNTSTSHTSLELALAHAMAYKWQGPNAQAGAYFVKMIGVEASHGNE